MKKRAMKKWIPKSKFYCYTENFGICKWWHDRLKSNNANSIKEKLCDYKPYCDFL